MAVASSATAVLRELKGRWVHAPTLLNLLLNLDSPQCMLGSVVHLAGDKIGLPKAVEVDHLRNSCKHSVVLENDIVFGMDATSPRSHHPQEVPGSHWTILTRHNPTPSPHYASGLASSMRAFFGALLASNWSCAKSRERCR